MDPNALIKEVHTLLDEDFLTWGSSEIIDELFEDLKTWLDNEGFEPNWGKFPYVFKFYSDWLKK